MARHLFAIFAHPDDEAFGPSGTLLMQKAAGDRIHLILLTNGSAGMNPDNTPDLGAVRLDEWRTAAALIGVDSLHYLEDLAMRDGRLSNTDMIAATERIETIVRSIILPNDSLSLLTYNLDGLTGHIDHIVAARATCLAFYRLKSARISVDELWLYSLTADARPGHSIEWLYADEGRQPVSLRHVDATEKIDTIRAIIRAHHSQRSDGAARLSDPMLGQDYFVIKH